MLVLVLAGLALTWIPSDHYIVLPDRARPTDPLVEIPGEEAGDSENGINMVDVRVGRANLLERIYPGIHEGAELLPERVINPQGVSDQQRRSSSLNQMSRSQLVAIAVALEHLGEDVEVTSFRRRGHARHPGRARRRRARGRRRHRRSERREGGDDR